MSTSELALDRVIDLITTTEHTAYIGADHHVVLAHGLLEEHGVKADNTHDMAFFAAAYLGGDSHCFVIYPTLLLLYLPEDR